MNTKYCVVSIVVFFVLVVSPYAFSEIDPATVAGMWLFEEGEGDVAKDSSDAGNDGTIVGPKKWQDGKFGKALEFNGNDVYVEVEANDSIILEELTIVVWANLKTSQGTRWQYIIMRGQNPRNYLLAVDRDDQTLQLSITRGAKNAFGGPKGGPEITNGEWHHLAGVIGADEGLVIYTDGVKVGEQAYVKPSLDAEPSRMRIGRSDEGHQCEGLLDEVALFNVPLSQEDIKTIMEKGLESATGFLAVDPESKLATTWGKLKTGL